MASKRKGGGKKPVQKRSRKQVEEDYESDLSDDQNGVDGPSKADNQIEVLIQSDELVPATKLPEVKFLTSFFLSHIS